MPRYYRRRSYRRYTPRRSYAAKRTYKIAKTAARSVVNQMAETKFVENTTQTSINTNGLNGTGTPNYGIARIVLPDQGIDQDERIGNTIKVKSIQLKFTYQGNAVNRFLRVVVFAWKSLLSGGATPAPGEVFNNILNGQITNISMLYNKEFANNYHILADKTYSTGSGTVVQDHIFIKKIPQSLKTVEMTGNTVFQPSFWYFVFSSDVIGANGAFAVQERLNFIDL